MANRKLAMPVALLISVVLSCARPPAEQENASAAGVPQFSKPSTAPEYLELVKALADKDSDETAKSRLPLHFRAPTAEEIEKMGPLWPSVPPEKNAAYYFGKAILEQADGTEAPPGSAASLLPYAGDIEALTKWVERNGPTLAAMREGLKQDVCCMPFEISDETGAPQPPMTFFSGMRQIARDLTDAGFVEEVRGNPDGAASYYLECIRLGKKLHNGTVIECLVGVAVQGIGQKALDSLIANANLSDTTLRGVIVACRKAEVAQEVPVRIFAANAAFVESQIALAKPPWPDDPAMIRDLGYQRALKGFVAGKPLDKLLQKRWMQTTYEKELKELADKESEQVLPRTFGELGKGNVRLRATQIRAAIMLYQRTERRLPESLDALCPAIIPSVPIDPFSGKPMRYAKTPGGWKIWSVGPDNLDNGGQEVAYTPAAIFNEVFTSQVQSNIERRSKGAIKSLPPPAEKPLNMEKAK